MNIDFETSGTVRVGNDDELRDALLAGGAVRLAGTGSQQLLVAAPTTKVRVISLAPMDRILRLEADDLTCTVEAGVRREVLDAALRENRLQLPCAGGGTIGGLFAADVHGPLGLGMHSPRSLLLGFEGMLAEGLSFKAGARVVKSVAGFDLQKLFVGSQGRLFAATRLHLKLRPARHQVNFVQQDLTQADAVAVFHRLRLLATAPSCLILRGTTGGAMAVHGSLEGPEALVEGLLREHRLPQDTDPVPLGLSPQGDEEVLQGTVLASCLVELLSRLPQLELIVFGGGRFQVRVHRTESDDVLASIRDLAADAWILRGGADRRCRSANGTVATGIERQLKQALDPNGVLS